MTLVSIVTCTYNSEKYIWDCIQWVINQNLNYRIFEHIFIDGGSSDRTIDIIENYKHRYPDNKIKIIISEAKWIYNAMNIWIKNSTWEYIIFCNSDDYLVDNVLLGYLSFIKKNRADIYYGKMNIVSDSKLIWIIGRKNHIKNILFYLWFNTLIYHPTALIKKSLFNELWYYDEKKKIASDYGFWLACIVSSKKIKYYPYIITNFRYHTSSITSNPLNKSIEWSENLYFRKKYLWIRWIIIHLLSILKYKLLW